MNIIKISFSDEEYRILEDLANERKVTIQDYIRHKVIKTESSIFKPEEAERRALTKLKAGDTFTLPDLYKDGEWGKISRGVAGVFGKRFYKYIESGSDTIEIVGMSSRRAQYRIK